MQFHVIVIADDDWFDFFELSFAEILKLKNLIKQKRYESNSPRIILEVMHISMTVKQLRVFESQIFGQWVIFTFGFIEASKRLTKIYFPSAIVIEKVRRL